MTMKFDPITQKNLDYTTTDIDWSSYNNDSFLPIVELKKLKKSYIKLETLSKILKRKLSQSESEIKKLQQTNEITNTILDRISRTLSKLDFDNPTNQKLVLEYMSIVEDNINKQKLKMNF